MVLLSNVGGGRPVCHEGQLVHEERLSQKLRMVQRIVRIMSMALGWIPAGVYPVLRCGTEWLCHIAGVGKTTLQSRKVRDSLGLALQILRHGRDVRATQLSKKPVAERACVC